jgi:hypothetical protein
MVVSVSQQEHFSHLSSPRSMTEADERAVDMMKMKTTEKRMFVVYFRLDN